MVTDVFPIISHRLPLHFSYNWCHQYPFDQQTFSSIFPILYKPFPTSFPGSHPQRNSNFLGNENESIFPFVRKRRERRTVHLEFQEEEKRRGRRETMVVETAIPVFDRKVDRVTLSLSLSSSLCFNELNTRGRRTNDRHREKNWIFRLAGCVTVRTETTVGIFARLWIINKPPAQENGKQMYLRWPGARQKGDKTKNKKKKKRESGGEKKERKREKRRTRRDEIDDKREAHARPFLD